MSTTHDLLAAAKSAGKKPVTDLEVVPVGNIKPSDIGKAVRVKANVEPRERICFENTLEVGHAYTITGFGSPVLKTCSLPADYIGCVLHVGDLRQPGVGNQRPVIWRDIILRNLEGNTVRFTLWNEKARDFDTDLYEKEPKPTVMAVSSCWVRAYGGLQLSSTVATYYYLNPAIPETEYILSMYGELLAPPVIQNVRTQRYDDIEQEKARNRTTIDELLREDPRNQTNVRFTVVATVTYVASGRAWYFRRCKDCRHKISEDRIHGHCKQPDPAEPNDYSYCFRIAIADATGALMLTCFSNEAHSVVTECNKVMSEEGYIDPYTLPPVLTALEGTTHLFQLHFALESTKENPVYILDAVMESGQHLLPAPENNPAVNEADMQIANEVLYLTGPEDEAERGNEPGTSTETAPATTPSPTMLLAPDTAATQATDESLQMPQAATPPSVEGLQVPPLVTTETTSQLQQPVAKAPATRTSVRRQLLKDEAVEQSPVTTKRAKKE